VSLCLHEFSHALTADRCGDHSVRELGYLPVTWSVNGFDWRDGETAEAIAARGLAAGAGDVILLHDGRRTEPAVDRSRSVDAAATIVHGLAQRGYNLVTVPELLAQNGSS